MNTGWLIFILGFIGIFLASRCWKDAVNIPDMLDDKIKKRLKVSGCFLAILFFIMSLVIVGFGLYINFTSECNRNSLKPIVNNNVTRIEFHYTLSYDPNSWEEIEEFRIEDKNDISQIINAIYVNSLERNSALLDSNIKMRFVYDNGEDTWVNYHVDRNRKEVYGKEWVSVELYDIFTGIGIIKPLKEMPLPGNVIPFSYPPRN